MLTACLRGISQVCLCQIPFQQESAEIGKCVDVIVEADIAAGELDAAVNVGILLTGNQCTKGFCRAVFRLDLYGNQRACRSDKEVLLQCGILPLVIIERIGGCLVSSAMSQITSSTRI